jgi:hypothetical protein
VRVTWLWCPNEDGHERARTRSRVRRTSRTSTTPRPQSHIDEKDRNHV